MMAAAFVGINKYVHQVSYNAGRLLKENRRVMSSQIKELLASSMWPNFGEFVGLEKFVEIAVFFFDFHF